MEALRQMHAEQMESIKAMFSQVLLSFYADKDRQSPTSANSATVDVGRSYQVNSSPPPFGAPYLQNNPQRVQLFSAVHSTRNMHLMAEKDFNAVIEHLDEPEPSAARNVKASFQSDTDLVKNICATGEVQGFVECWRNPGKSTSRARILKVRFLSTNDRDNFLRKFRSSLPLNIAGKPRVRRDMTPPELQLLYELRKTCYELNQECGWQKHYIRDLTIAENQTRRYHPQSVPTPNFSTQLH